MDMSDEECTYAVMPVSTAGTMECNQAFSLQFSFDYADTVSLVAIPPESGAFSEQELREVIAILKSFKLAERN